MYIKQCLWAVLTVFTQHWAAKWLVQLSLLPELGYMILKDQNGTVIKEKTNCKTGLMLPPEKRVSQREQKRSSGMNSKENKPQWMKGMRFKEKKNMKNFL